MAPESGTKGQLSERRRRAAEMRLAGATYEQIAKQLDYAGAQGAFSAVQSGLDEAMVDPTSTVRQLELERLDALLLGLWPKARAGDVKAIDRVLRIMERRASYLGLDRELRVPVVGPSAPGSPHITQIAEQRAKRRGQSTG